MSYTASDHSRPLPTGKLPAGLLATLLARIEHCDPRVLLGPGVGEDAAVIDLGDRCLVAKTDPVTFATDEIGWYAVHVNANDVACCGAVPRWFLATVLLPETTSTPALAERVFDQLSDACRELGITLCGGHTEITAGLDRPIVVGQMLGEVAREDVITTAGARPGDVLVLTKGIAIEGTSILARECRERLAGAVSAATLDAAASLLHEPGISVVRDARVAIAAGGVHALHDPTEGGLATGLAELATAAAVGITVDAPAIPVLAECRALCAALGVDPLGLIASGALLAAVDPRSVDGVLGALERDGIAVHVIGRVAPPTAGRILTRTDGGNEPLPEFARDELARLLA